MNYFQIQFDYDGKVVKLVDEGPGTHKASAILCKVIDDLVKILDNLNIQNAHAYAYPDGSLYRYIRTDMNEENMKETISKALPEHIRILNVWSHPSDENPRKLDFKTLKKLNTLNDYFESIYDENGKLREERVWG